MEKAFTLRRIVKAVFATIGIGCFLLAGSITETCPLVLTIILGAILAAIGFVAIFVYSKI